VTGERKPKGKWRRILLKVFVGLAVLVGIIHFPVGRVRIEVSPETTVLEGPLRADGTVDYAAALDRCLSDGVTPENNAAVEIILALGPNSLPEDTGEEVLERLGLTYAELKAAGGFFSWRDWCEIHSMAEEQETGGQAARGSLKPGDTTSRQPPDRHHPDLHGLLPALRKEWPRVWPSPWLVLNERPLDRIVAASRLPRYYVPVVVHPRDLLLVRARHLRSGDLVEAAVALLARAEVRYGCGDAAESWEDVLAAHRLARLVGQCPEIIPQLTAMAIENYAAEEGREMAGRGPGPPALARRILGELMALERVGGVETALGGWTRYQNLDTIAAISCGRMDLSEVFSTLGESRDLDYNTMLRVTNRWYDLAAEAQRKPTYAARLKASQTVDAELCDIARDAGRSSCGNRLAWLRLGGWPFRSARSEIVARLLLALAGPSSVQNASGAVDHVAMAREIEILAVALACFHHDNDRWPDELAELCPKYVEAIPPDRFTGKPLIYRPRADGYLLYSVGRNMNDDGGRLERHGEADDIVAEAGGARGETRPVSP